jgi:hypothetical protein
VLVSWMMHEPSRIVLTGAPAASSRGGGPCGLECRERRTQVAKTQRMAGSLAEGGAVRLGAEGTDRRGQGFDRGAPRRHPAELQPRRTARYVNLAPSCRAARLLQSLAAFRPGRDPLLARVHQVAPGHQPDADEPWQPCRHRCCCFCAESLTTVARSPIPTHHNSPQSLTVVARPTTR